tara:strand:+ start:2202 stop:2582 length:381 start_codon:yes stop_codon:yes gene_type:complete
MITEYCTKCGAKYEYSLNKPKFCSSCGTSLDGEVSQATAKEQDTKVIEQQDILPSISKLEYSLNSGGKPVTFGDLVSEGSRDSSGNYEKASSRPKPKYDPSEDVVKSTMQQCSSKRDPDEVGGEEK